MLLFKLIQQICYSSVFIFVLFLIAILCYKKKFAKPLIIISFLIYYFFSIAPIADLIIKPLETKYPVITKQALKKTQTVVLLLGSKQGSQIRSNEVLRLNKASNKPLKIYISGSVALRPDIKAGQELKNYLIERGIKSKNIILEDKSKNTYQSAKYLAPILKDNKFLLVTSSYHMPRSIYLFKKFNTNPIPAPTDIKIKKGYDILDFFPKANNLEKTDAAFHEYIGLFYYKIFKF